MSTSQSKNEDTEDQTSKRSLRLSQDPSPPSIKVKKLIVGGVPEHFNAPWHIAQERGIFKKHNIEIEVRSINLFIYLKYF